MVSVPAVLILAPLSWSAEVPLIFATLKVPLVPLSANESKVLAPGVFVSLIVSVPLELLAPKVMTGEVALSERGVEPESVIVPEASRVVTPEIAPALVIPPVLLFMPLEILAPPETVSPPELIV